MPSPLEIYAANAAFGDRVNALEVTAIRDLTKGYADAWAALKARYDPLAERVIANGGPVRPGDLYRMERFKALMSEVEAQYHALASLGTNVAATAVRDAIDAGLDDYRRSLAALDDAGIEMPAIDWDVAYDDRLAKAQLGFTAEGSPLRDLFERWGVDAAKGARSTLVAGVSAGLGTDVIARQLRQSLAIGLWRSQLIARTEAHRAYREVGRLTAEANPAAFNGWIWRAACDGRTCSICWALHGTTYPSNEKMYTHPGCRCALVPLPRTFRELVGGRLPDPMQTAMRTGPQLFAKLPPNRQLRILGPARFRLYQDGYDLPRLIHTVPGGRWGPQRRLIRLRDFRKSLGAGAFVTPPANAPQPKIDIAKIPWINNAAKRRRAERFLRAHPDASAIPRAAIKEGQPDTVKAPRPRGQPAARVNPPPATALPPGHPPVPAGARAMTPDEWDRHQRRVIAGQEGLVWKVPALPGAHGHWGRPMGAAMTRIPRQPGAPRPAALPPQPNPAIVAPQGLQPIPAHDIPNPVRPGEMMRHPEVPLNRDPNARLMNNAEVLRHAKRLEQGLPGLEWIPAPRAIAGKPRSTGRTGQGHWGRVPGVPLSTAMGPLPPTVRPVPGRPGKEVVQPPIPPRARPMNDRELQRQFNRAEAHQKPLRWDPLQRRWRRPLTTGGRQASVSGMPRRPVAPAAPRAPAPPAPAAPPVAAAPVAPAAPTKAPRTPGGVNRVLGGRAPVGREAPNAAIRRRWLRWRADNPNAPAWATPPKAYLKAGGPSTIIHEPNWIKANATRVPRWGGGRRPTAKLRAAAARAQQQAQWSVTARARANNPQHPAIPMGARPMSPQEWAKHTDRLRNGEPGLIWKPGGAVIGGHWGAPLPGFRQPGALAPQPRPVRVATVLKPLPSERLQGPPAPAAPGNFSRDITGRSASEVGIIPGMAPETPTSPLNLPAGAKSYPADEAIRQRVLTGPITNIRSNSQHGVSESYFCEIDGVPCIVKPTSGQRVGIRPQIDAHTETEREYGGYVVNRHLGWALDHQSTVIRDFGDAEYSADIRGRPQQVKLERAIVSPLNRPEPGWQFDPYGTFGDVPPETQVLAAMFDSLIANTDRHGNNYFTSRRGGMGGRDVHLIAIDPSLAFPVLKRKGEMITAVGQDWLKAGARVGGIVQGLPLTPEAIERLRVFLVDELLVRAELEPMMGRAPVDQMYARARWMWTHGRTMSQSELNSSATWWDA